MPVDTVVNLVILIRQHRLLEPAQLDELARTIAPNFPEPRGLAKELIQRNWLTPYQINQLFKGNGADLVFDNFVLLERLGEGGMGQVFKARHRKLGQIVALKIIRKDRNAGPDSIRRFEREIQTASTLVHPNIVRAIDANEVDGTHFFVMEYVEGTDLARLVKQQGPLPPAQAAEYIRQAALGLQHAHEKGLVHRDIKPANLLLTKQGVIKLVDMGLARRENIEEAAMSTALTQEGSVLGTPDYIAPEQARNSSTVDIRSDLYSLGCTFYFLLTGQPPFPGGALTEKLLKHQLDMPEPLTTFRSDVPPRLAAVIEHLMAKRPDDRYQTPAELAAALAGGEAVAPRSGKNLGRPSNDSGRTPAPLSYPMATPVPSGFRSGTVPVAVPVTADPFADLDTPSPISVTHIERLPRRPAPRRPWWLLGVVAFVIVLFAAMVGVGARLLLAKPKAPVDPVEVKDKDAVTDKDPKKEERPRTPQPWKARELLAKRGAQFEPLLFDDQHPTTSVVLNNSATLTDADLFNLTGLPTLTSLNLSGCTKITDKGMVHLAGLTKLTSLTLHNTAVTDEGLAPLQELTALEYLDLSYTQVHGSGLVHVHGAKKLKVLNLTYSKADDAGLIGLEGMPQLEQLTLQMPPASKQITSAGMIHLKGLTKLKLLSLYDNNAVDDAGMVHFKAVGLYLTSLDLTNTKVGDTGLSRFKTLSHLVTFQATGTHVGDKGLPALQNATKLQTVGLGSTNVQDDGLAVFSDKKELHTLGLWSTRVGNDGLKKLAGEPLMPALDVPAVVPGTMWALRYATGPQKLLSLGLDKTLVTDAGLIHLTRQKELTTLSLASTQVRGPGLASLKELHKLTWLSLENTLIDDAALEHVGALTQLNALSLLGCHNLTDAGLVYLKGLKHLTSLTLQDTPISDKGLAELEELKTLQSLNLAQTKPRVTDEGVTKLKKALPNVIVTAHY